MCVNICVCAYLMHMYIKIVISRVNTYVVAPKVVFDDKYIEGICIYMYLSMYVCICMRRVHVYVNRSIYVYLFTYQCI